MREFMRQFVPLMQIVLIMLILALALGLWEIR